MYWTVEVKLYCKEGGGKEYIENHDDISTVWHSVTNLWWTQQNSKNFTYWPSQIFSDKVWGTCVHLWVYTSVTLWWLFNPLTLDNAFHAMRCLVVHFEAEIEVQHCINYISHNRPNIGLPTSVIHVATPSSKGFSNAALSVHSSAGDMLPLYAILTESERKSE